MTKMTKLTKFEIQTEWSEKDVPTNQEKLTPVFVNTDNIEIIQTVDYFLPGGPRKDEWIPKTLITFSSELDLWVNESIEEVLSFIEHTHP